MVSDLCQQRAWGSAKPNLPGSAGDLAVLGSNIRQIDGDVGTLVSVTIAETTDTGSTTFSLLIPRMTLWNGQPAHIRTVGVVTLHRLTIDTPAHGQLDTYQLHHLSGTASVVEL
jgi:hypothetical protein